MRAPARKRVYSRVGWAVFAAAVLSALVAIWSWDQRWLATAGVLLFAALILCLAGADL